MSTPETYNRPRSRHYVLLAIFIIVVVGVGGAIGASNLPDQWYQALAKPPFNPPNWVFGPAWLFLYILIAIAGWRSFREGPSTLGMQVWCAQMLLNWIWPPIFFSLHAVWPAFCVIAALLVAALAYIAVSWRDNRPSALLFVPYVLWLAFAGSLNLSIAILN